jgi:branched-chain amino acid transport system ATP-binding protein
MTDVNGQPVLELRGVHTHYGPIHILKNVNISIYPGEIVCLLGGNASGKTTTLKTILGYVTPTEGEVVLDGKRISGLPTQDVVRGGISMVPENRRLFQRMTVRENLEMGHYMREDDEVDADLERVFELFPRVKERLGQRAGTLSGGEQQMVAVGRALMARPKVLLMDEPSMGLAPVLVEQNFDIIEQINEAGTTVFMVEQNANMALSIADYGYIMETGKMVMDGDPAKLLKDEDVKEFYLGLHATGEQKSFRDVKHYKRRKRWLS